MTPVPIDQRPLTRKEKQFVEAIVLEGLSRADAYGRAFSVGYTNDEEQQKLQAKADKLFYKPNVRLYYDTKMDEVRNTEKDRVLWNKEMATETLLVVIDKAKEELEDGNITMARITGITGAVKELNTMHGLNAPTKVDVEGGVVLNIIEDKLED